MHLPRYVNINPNPMVSARLSSALSVIKLAQLSPKTSSHLRRTILNQQHVFQRTDIGAGRSRRVDRCVRAISFRRSGSWLTCDSAEWPRVLENVLQRLHQVCNQILLASHPSLHIYRIRLTRLSDRPQRISASQTTAPSSSTIHHRSRRRSLDTAPSHQRTREPRPRHHPA